MPFLQVVLPGFKLVPLVMGDPDIATCRWLAEAIVECTKGKSVLIVASSDLSHYHSYDVAAEMDQRLLQKIGAMDIEGIEAVPGGPKMRGLRSRTDYYGDACRNKARRRPVRHSAIRKLGGCYRREKVSHGGGWLRRRSYFETSDLPGQRRSGEEEGRNRPWPDQRRAGGAAPIARKAIEARLTSGASLSRGVETASPKLKEPRGAFVTLYRKGELRGCIGQIVAKMPLAEAVAAMAEEAAFRDPRFNAGSLR